VESRDAKSRGTLRAAGHCLLADAHVKSGDLAVTIEDRPSPRERQLEDEVRRLKSKVGELVMQIDVLKKLDDFVRQRKNATSSVVTASNLARLRKDVQ